MRMMKVRSKSFLHLTGLIAVGYLTALICFTLVDIRTSGNSRAFLQQVSYVPMHYRKLVFSICAVVVLIVAAEILLEKLSDCRHAALLLHICLSVELLAGVFINYYLVCSFRNAFYLVVGNIFLYPVRKRGRFVFIAIALLLYVATDVNQVANKYLPYSFELLMSYLGEGATKWQGILGMLRTVNDIAFILLCLTAINTTAGEKDKIEALNIALKRTIDELHVSNIQLKQQARHNEEFAIYKERLRFSREMHDIIGHVLTGVVVGLRACDALNEDKQSPLAQQTKRLSQLASNGLDELRTAINDTRMLAKDAYSLVDEINELVDAVSQCVGMCIRVDFSGDARALNSIQENVVYRIAQESITNALRHANAENLSIRVAISPEGVRVSIDNDGVVDGSLREGFGLTNMRERVENLGGDMQVHTEQMGIFRLEIYIPMEGKQNDASFDR